MFVAEEVRKAYGGRAVLNDVTLKLRPGRIHALLGPNGSGKSTLIGCLSGAVARDGGRIVVDGVEHGQMTPRGAMELGTAVIYQHFSLVPTLTVAENIFLGGELRRRAVVDRTRQRRATRDLLARLGRDLDPDAPVGSLSTGEQQIVEIAKALHHRPRVLVLDEPTAALGQREASALGRDLKRLRDGGMAVLYVTHLLNEVFAIADYVTVLRDGSVVLSSPVEDLSSKEVISAIAPASVGNSRQRAQKSAGERVLELRDFSVPGAGPIDLSVRRGEILAIFGLLGSGRTELLEGIFGIERDTGGELRVHGRLLRPREPAEALRRGVALIAGDRLRQSMLPAMSALDNVMLPHHRTLARLGIRHKRRERAEFDSVTERMRIEPPWPDARAWTFSGGNQQKLAVGRWLTGLAGIDVLLLDEPTQGIDVGARGDLYGVLHGLARKEGKAVLFTSSDPEEVQALADRVIVLRNGRTVAAEPVSAVTDRGLLEFAHGAESNE